MANVDNPNGAKPVGTISGAPWQGLVRSYLADGTGSDIFIGDFVSMSAAGKIVPTTAANAEIVGVCVGFQPAQAGQTNGVTDNFLGNTSYNLSKKYYDASVDGDAWILVAAGPDILFEIQTSGTIAYTGIGNNADIVATAGDTLRGRSQQELNSAIGTGTAQLRLIEPVNRPDNDVSSANSRWIVRVNESHYTKLAGV